VIHTGELGPEAFVARDKEGPIRSKSAQFHHGPYRIAFVVENGRELPGGARGIEATIVTRILSKLSGADQTFALLTARGPRVELHFGSRRDAIRSAVENLRNPPSVEEEGEGVLDGLLEATKWFGSPRPGDSIFLLAHNLKGRNRARFAAIRDALAGSGVRVFSVELGHVMQPGYTPFNFEEAYSIPAVGIHNPDQLIDLSEASGGGWGEVPKTNHGKGGPTEADVRDALAVADDLYMQASAFYVLGLDRTHPRVTIGMSPHALRELPGAYVIYPRYMRKCRESGPGTPDKARTTK